MAGSVAVIDKHVESNQLKETIDDLKQLNQKQNVEGKESKCAEIEKSVGEEASNRTCKSKHAGDKINKAELNVVQTPEKNKNEKEKYEKSIKKQKKSKTAVPSTKESIEHSTATQCKKGSKAKTAIKSKSWADMAEEEEEEGVVGIMEKVTGNSRQRTNDTATVGIISESRKTPDTITIDGRINELPAKQKAKRHQKNQNTYYFHDQQT